MLRTFRDSATGLLVKPIWGAQLQAQLGHWSQTALALIGHELQTGEAALTCATPRQTAALVGVPMALLRTIKKAMPFELAALKDGRYTVGALHKDQLANKPPINDVDIDRFIERAGASRVFDGLDRATRPGRTNGHAAANDNTGGNGSLPVRHSYRFETRRGAALARRRLFHEQTNRSKYMTIKHLEYDYINTIALELSEDVHGANGDLDDQEIKRRLIEAIHDHTDYAYHDTGMMPVWRAADLIRSVWEYMDQLKTS